MLTLAVCMWTMQRDIIAYIWVYISATLLSVEAAFLPLTSLSLSLHEHRQCSPVCCSNAGLVSVWILQEVFSTTTVECFLCDKWNGFHLSNRIWRNLDSPSTRNICKHEQCVCVCRRRGGGVSLAVCDICWESAPLFLPPSHPPSLPLHPFFNSLPPPLSAAFTLCPGVVPGLIKNF